jgi:hypothetical protein
MSACAHIHSTSAGLTVSVGRPGRLHGLRFATVVAQKEHKPAPQARTPAKFGHAAEKISDRSGQSPAFLRRNPNDEEN